MWEFTVRASYIVFLFVNYENNNFIKEIKHVVRAFIACWKPRQSLWKFSSRWKSRVFTDLLSNSPKRSPRFSPAYEDTENMFYFLDRAWMHGNNGRYGENDSVNFIIKYEFFLTFSKRSSCSGLKISTYGTDQKKMDLIP